MKKIAVVLSGCGNKDGTEITEAVSLIVNLSQLKAQVSFFAPDLEFQSLNFLTQQPLEKRNMMIESARITRSKIQDLNSLVAKDFDALAFPGGYGAASLLCDWSIKGHKCNVLPEVEAAIRDFYKQSKPIAAICIAPVLLARVLGSEGIQITVGKKSETSVEIEKTGALHIDCPVDDFVTDRDHKVITTPAYMESQATPFEVFTGIKKLSSELMEMA